MLGFQQISCLLLFCMLEREMNEIKIKYKTVKNVTNENCLTKEGSLIHNDVEDNSSTPKMTKEKIQKVKKKDELLCTPPGRRPGTAEGGERPRPGGGHSIFFNNS